MSAIYYRELIQVTSELAKTNPTRKFFIDMKAGVTGVEDTETKEIVPILSAILGGGVAKYHNCQVNGQTPTHTWAKVEVLEEVSA